MGTAIEPESSSGGAVCISSMTATFGPRVLGAAAHQPGPEGFLDCFDFWDKEKPPHATVTFPLRHLCRHIVDEEMFPRFKRPARRGSSLVRPQKIRSISDWGDNALDPLEE
jgi:hypothetical protein